jgi:hypothetical protein
MTAQSELTPVERGTYVRWGLRLFIFGLVVGYGPWLHYMHGALEEVHPAFLHNVTLWFACPWTLATYVAQLDGPAMIPIGLGYVVFGRDGSLSSVTSGERRGPMLCAVGIVSEFVCGFPGYFAVSAVWPNFCYAPVDAGKWTWFGLQGICIAIFLAGVIVASGGITRATRGAVASARTFRPTPFLTTTPQN